MPIIVFESVSSVPQAFKAFAILDEAGKVRVNVIPLVSNLPATASAYRENVK